MKRWWFLLLSLLFYTSSVEAQVQLNLGQAELSLNANAGAAPQTGVAFAIPAQGNLVTWIISFASAPASHSTILEFSNDNVIWAVGDTSTNVLGETRNVFTGARFVRATESARSGGGAITVSIIIKPSENYGPAWPTTYVAGDILYANSSNTLTRLPIGLQGRPLVVTAGLIPSWTEPITVTTGILINGSGGGTFSAVGGAGYSGDASAYYSIAGRGYWDTSAAGLWRLQNSAGTIGSTFKVDALPTIQAGWGTSPSVIAGSTPFAGGVNVGTGGASLSGSINFNGTAFPQAPFCVVSTNSPATGFLYTSSTTTVLTISSNAPFASAAQVYWICASQR